MPFDFKKMLAAKKKNKKSKNIKTDIKGKMSTEPSDSMKKKHGLK